jgi:hypothetical protein
MTRTWWQWALQRNDSDLLGYDFAEGCPAWEAWWFRIAVAVVCIFLVWFFFFA